MTLPGQSTYESLLFHFESGGEWALPRDADPACMDEPWTFDESDRGGSSHVNDARMNRARIICATCPWRINCLDFALRHDVSGIWGGEKFINNRRVRAGAA